MDPFFANCLRIIFYVLLYLNAQSLVDQQVITLKYNSGQPKIRYQIRANDTFCIENLLENGHPYSMTWRDSVHFFHPNQVVSFKTCNVEDSARWMKIDWAEIACNQNLPEFKGTVIGRMEIANLDFTEFTDVLIACTAASAYFPNGVLHERITGQSDRLFKLA
jgi:hypothetical protein